MSRLIIAGDRRFGHIPKKPKPSEDDKLVYEDARAYFRDMVLELWHQWKDLYWPVSEVISGGASGIDSIGEELASHMTGKKAKIFEANWFLHKKSAGPKRNEDQSMYADGAIIIGTSKSIGSLDMAKRMRSKGKPVLFQEIDLGEVDLYCPGIKSLYQLMADRIR